MTVEAGYNTEGQTMLCRVQLLRFRRLRGALLWAPVSLSLCGKHSSWVSTFRRHAEKEVKICARTQIVVMPGSARLMRRAITIT